MIVDYAYYSTVYMGTEADAASFPTLNAHASRVICAMARWQVSEDNFSELPEIVQTMYKLAVCSQVDFFAISGVDSMNTQADNSFTVGKVSVQGVKRNNRSGAMSDSVSPAALYYLEQSGLMNPAVPVVGGCVC